MNILKKHRKNFTYIAGAAFALYAIFGFLGGLDLVWAIFYSAILALGVSCILKGRLEKAEIIANTALAVISLIVVYSLITEIIALAGILFSGRFGLGLKIQLLLSLIPGFVHAAAWILTFAFSLLLKTRHSFQVKKFWYVPAACFVLSALLGIAVNVIFMLINLSFSFHLILLIFKEIILYVIIAAAVLLYDFNLTKD